MARLFWMVLALASVCTMACAEDDENKPYKFGFNIEKYQHRLEEKDKKGLIKGEFGFVTGDGVYHETAYATDEQGDFKILGMRSYFVGLPGVDLPDITKGAPTARLPDTTTAAAPAPAPQPVAQTILSGVMGCSGCHIPDKNAQPLAQPVLNGQTGNSPNGPFSRPPSAFGGPGAPSGLGTSVGNRDGQHSQQGSQGGRPAFTAVDDGNSNIKVGGFSPDEMKALLYRFNYTVGFHGHHEVGDRAGHKEGGYHFNGRDGMARHVAYTANEFGFQPNITLHELSGQDTPREDTEKSPEFGLRGYEFVWFNGKQASRQQR